jgi:hypothetical protein
MTSYPADPKHKQTWLGSALSAVASLAVVTMAVGLALAASGRSERVVTSIESRIAGEPIMAIVSLRSQLITVYDAEGWILRAPISSGQRGTRDAGRYLQHYPERSRALF